MKKNLLSNNNNNEIHIWRINLNEICLITPRFLCPDEKKRLSKLRFEKHKTHFLKVRYCLREILSYYTTILPNYIQFEYNQFHKPYISVVQNEKNVFFNLSHTEEDLYIAISFGQEVGVDIERIESKKISIDVAESFMTKKELSFISSLETMQIIYLYQIWTQKEAYLKALGTGFFTNPQEVSVVLNKGLEFRNEQVGEKWMSVYSAENKFLSICSENPHEVSFKVFTQ